MKLIIRTQSVIYTTAPWIIMTHNAVVIEASVNNFVNTCSWTIFNVVDVVKIVASVNNFVNTCSWTIFNVVNVVRTFLGLFFSVNEEVCGTWFPRDLGVQGEEEADCQGKKCYLKRAHLASPH